MAKKPGRIGEGDISQDVIAIVDGEPGRQITTTKLISELRKRIPLNAQDQELLDSRQDDRFSQIVRNIKSHQTTPGNLIYDGHLQAIPRGFKRP